MILCMYNKTMAHRDRVARATCSKNAWPIAIRACIVGIIPDAGIAGADEAAPEVAASAPSVRSTRKPLEPRVNPRPASSLACTRQSLLTARLLGRKVQGAQRI
jgi:hypothetical protein